MISDAEHVRMLRDLVDWHKSPSTYHVADGVIKERKPKLIAALERAIEVLSRSSDHFVEITVGNLWACEHPQSCRDLGSLTDCPVHLAICDDLYTDGTLNWPVGRHLVWIDPNDGELYATEQI